MRLKKSYALLVLALRHREVQPTLEPWVRLPTGVTGEHPWSRFTSTYSSVHKKSPKESCRAPIRAL